MRYIGIFGLLVVSCLIASLIGCQRDVAEQLGPTVIVSIEPQAYLVEQIGGDRVKVLTLVRSGESPATYQPSDVQVSEMMKAKVYFRIGVPFEQGRWLDALTKTASLRIVDTRQNISLQAMGSQTHHELTVSGLQHQHHNLHESTATSPRDPHIWLTPQLLKIQAKTITETLIAVDPRYQDTYRRNLATLETRLDEANGQIRRTLASSGQRVFFVFHPSWGYFANEYGLQQVALELGGKEPSDRELTELQKRARELNVRTIFVQPQISGHSAQAIADAIGGRVVPLDPLAHDVLKNLLEVAATIADAPTATRSKP